MDICLLSTMLRELLLENNRVSLPGLGTFVAEDSGASFSGKGLAIHPPYRNLSFVIGSGDDRLLKEFYSSSNGIDIRQASSIIDNFTSHIKAELLEIRNIEFPGLGRLRVTRNGDLFFIPDENLDISPNLFGLESISLRSHCLTDDAPSISSGTASEPSHSAMLEPDSVPEPLPVSGSPEIPAHCDVEETDYRCRPTIVRLMKILATVLVFLLAAMVAFVILSRLNPEFVDSLLYTSEELEIVNHPL